LKNPVPGCFLWLILCAASCLVNAGVQNIGKPIYEFKQIAALAKGLERSLAARHARVAIIGRLGLPPEIMPPGIRFSHAAFAVYSRIETSDHRMLPGYAVYNLYGSLERTARSHLAQDYPVDYLAISQRLEVGVVIPDEKFQELLLRTIASPRYTRLHVPDYSVIANPYNLKYQNCTEFVLDVIFASLYDTDDTARIKASIRAYFRPAPLPVDLVKLQLASLAEPEVRLDDHDGPVVTATFKNIAQFLLDNDIAEDAYVYTINPLTMFGKIEKPEF